jgi:WD40 repeat protein
MVHNVDEGITLVEIANYTSIVSLQGETGFDFSLSPDGSKIAAEDIGVDYIRTVIWDISSRTILTTLDQTVAPRFSPDGRFLAGAYYDYEHNRVLLKIFTPDGVKEITSLDVNEGNGLTNKAPLWSLDSSLIATQIPGGSPAAWDTTNWELLDTPDIQGELYALSPDGRILITRTSDGGILLWGVLQ